MMKLRCSNGLTVNYYDLQDREKPDQVSQAEVSVTSILFDESHGELLRSQSSLPDENVITDSLNTWDNLKQLLRENFGAESIVSHTNDKGLITSEILANYQILVLAAPTNLFSPEEIKAITQFVLDGNSLLIAASSSSLRKQRECAAQQKNRNGQDINSLLKHFGLQFKSLFSSPAEEILDLKPHFLSSEINRLFIDDPAYLEISSDIWQFSSFLPYIVARLPHPSEPWLAAIEPSYRARVIAISDFAVFTDNYFIDGNKQLALNIFRWLAFVNQLDCSVAEVKSEIQYGETATFCVSLSNPHGKRLEYVSCLLEAEMEAEILDSAEKHVRSLAPYSETQICWTIKPIRIGLQKLKLTIDCLNEPTFMPLFFDVAAQFKCMPDVEFDLVILNHEGEVSEITETGKPIEVKVGLRPKSSILASSFQFSLVSSSPEVVVETLEQSSGNHWRLTTEAAGDHPITLTVSETGQQISRLLRVQQSVQERIVGLEKNTIVPLNQEIQHCIEDLRCGLDVEEIQKIPFRLYTPEDYAHLIYSGRTEILDIIRAARRETQENRRLVLLLLKYILPLYSPVHGCCIPYDPQLALHLLEQHPYYQEYLSENFLCLGEDDQISREQNLAALILHEKYGHGFFFTQTTLGKQLSILFRHGLYPDADSSQMKSPYPRLLFEAYKTVIQELWQSTVVLDEGFATWVELTVLPRLSGSAGQGAFRRKVFLFNDDEGRYQSGYEYFEFIHSFLGAKAVLQVMLAVADIDIGVVEEGGKVRFSLDARVLETALQSTSADSIRPDVRLARIYEAIYQSSQKIRLGQGQVRYNRDKDYFDSLICALIRERLG